MPFLYFGNLVKHQPQAVVNMFLKTDTALLIDSILSNQETGHLLQGSC